MHFAMTRWMTSRLLMFLVVFGATLATDKCLPDMTFWYGRCYIFYPTPMNVTSARDICHRKHSTLATVDSTSEMDWMMTRMVAVPDVTTWHMSLYNEARTHIVSQCNWTDGAPVVYHRYAPLSTSHVTERCVIINVARYGQGSCAWHEVACDSQHAVVCSRLYLAPLPNGDANAGENDLTKSGTAEADNRSSARAIGYIAIVLMLAELCFLIILDWTDVMRSVEVMKKHARVCLCMNLLNKRPKSGKRFCSVVLKDEDESEM